MQIPTGRKAGRSCADRELNHAETVRACGGFAAVPGCDSSHSIPSSPVATHDLFVETCADRELNPGYELGKLMSYH